MAYVPSFEHYGTYDESEYPHLWNGRVGAWCPSVNPAGGTRLGDHSQFRNWGTLTNGPTWQTSVGKTSLFHDGTDDYVSLGAAQVGKYLNNATAITLSAWVNPTTITSVSSGNLIFVARNSGVSGAAASLWLRVRGDVGNIGKIEAGGRSISTDSFQSTSSISTINTATWSHVVCQLDYRTDEIRIFINGRLDVSTSVTFSSSVFVQSDSANVDTIGGDVTTTSRAFSGLLDDISISSFAVNGDEVRELYMLGRGGAYMPRRRMFWPVVTQSFQAAWARRSSQLIGGGIG